MEKWGAGKPAQKPTAIDGRFLPSPAARHYAFGEYVLDVLRCDLWRRGQPVTITPRLFRALRLFAEHPQELLGKDWLMARLWPGLMVEENNLSQIVSGLRRVLNDDGLPYIRTETRRGFRFVRTVTALSSETSLSLVGPLEPHAGGIGAATSSHLGTAGVVHLV